MSQLAIELLIKKRDELIAELVTIQSKYETEIDELNSAIVELSGKPLSQTKKLVPYSDEHPDYIKQSIED